MLLFALHFLCYYSTLIVVFSFIVVVLLDFNGELKITMEKTGWRSPPTEAEGLLHVWNTSHTGYENNLSLLALQQVLLASENVFCYFW